MSGIRNLKRVGLDSNIFIYNLGQNPEFVKFTDTIFQAMVAGNLAAVTSVVTLTEILSFPMSTQESAKIADDFFSTPNLEIIELNRKIAENAAKIRRDYKFLLPDAVQLATALFAGSQSFITNDKRLKSFKKLLVTLLTEIK